MSGPSRISRRQLLVTSGLAPCAGIAAFLATHVTEAAPVGGSAVHDFVDSPASGTQQRRMHGGKGLLDVKFFFEPERPAKPALFLQYDMPPQSSEGVHTHGPGRVEGAWDEYYYIAEGEGRMRIGDDDVVVSAGDTIHTPLGVPHGIENTSATGRLRVFLVAVERA